MPAWLRCAAELLLLDLAGEQAAQLAEEAAEVLDEIVEATPRWDGARERATPGDDDAEPSSLSLDDFIAAKGETRAPHLGGERDAVLVEGGLERLRMARHVAPGVGPLADTIGSIDGVDMLGFVQPDEMPSVFARAGCLVLPSRHEPWAVVIHEAASAGLPVVCTRACGASTRLVLDGLNGAVVSPS